jgi:CO/xanthine dehydrogenase Mo-binding subunit
MDGLAPPVGTSVPRVDGVSKVTGRARYLDDIDAPSAWHGATVRSTVAHGVLEAIDLDPAFDWSKVVVVTAEDIRGQNMIRLIEDDQPALVAIGKRVMHVDEAIALVAAPSRELAFAAAKAVKPRVKPLAPVFELAAALAAEIKLYGDDNVFKQFLVRKGHATDDELEAAFASAAQVIEGSYYTSPQEQMYIEPQAMMAEWPNGPDGKCIIVGSMQCPYYVHKAMKAFLGCEADGVVIQQSVTGGGFGGKEEYPSMLAAHVALLAQKAKCPVKIVYDRDEDIAATTKRHPCWTKHRLAVDAKGEIAAIDVDVMMDGGAYLTLSPVVLSRGVLHAAGPYRCPIVRVRGRVIATNHPPHGAFRGFGAPQTTFAYERQIQKLARARGEDPLALRTRLALRSGDTTATGQELGFSVGTDEVLTAIRECAGTPPARDGVNAFGAPVRRGRGVVFYFHGAGFTGSGEQRLAGRASVAATADGRFEVRSSSTDIGQGAITMFAQIAAGALGVDVSLVTVVDPSTAQVPDSGPTVASRTCMVVGGVVDRAAKALRDRLLAWARARDVGGDLPAIAKDHGQKIGELVETVQYEPPPGIAFDDATYTGAAYPVYGWAACLVDVAVDLDTYEVAIERCVQAVDVGKAINPSIVRGQIDGGTLQALGWAVLENVVYKNGKVANANMTNCIVPTFADAPDLETILIEVPYPFGPSGAKGVGEIPMDGPAAAVANAVEDALGCAFDELPISPEHVAASRHKWRFA